MATPPKARWCLRLVNANFVSRVSSGALASAKRMDQTDLAQILLGVQRQLQQALEKLILWNAHKVFEYQLLRKQPANVSELQHLVARRIDEIPVAVIDDDEVTFRIEARTPQLPRRLVVGIAGKPLVGRIAATRPADKRGGHRDLRFGPADDVALRNDDFDACEARFAGRAERRDLSVGRVERSIAFARVPANTGDHVQVDIRGKLLSAAVVKPPFVRHGKSLLV